MVLVGVLLACEGPQKNAQTKDVHPQATRGVKNDPLSFLSPQPFRPHACCMDSLEEAQAMSTDVLSTLHHKFISYHGLMDVAHGRSRVGLDG